MKKRFLILLLILLVPIIVFARAGGGGSSSGGSSHSSSGGSSSRSSFSSSNSSSSSANFPTSILIIVAIIFFIFFFFIFIFSNRFIRRQLKRINEAKLKKEAETEKKVQQASLKDQLWTKEKLLKRVSEVFYAFEKDWSNFDVGNMKKYLHPDYYPKMVLEMNALKNIGRQNKMSEVNLESIELNLIKDENNNNSDQFSVFIQASATDEILSSKDNKILNVDTSSFNEEWFFARVGDEWLLKSIGQSTANENYGEKEIAEFANNNKFYYDIDFGWLMMPKRGAIFSLSSFSLSDINNHVIGYYRDKIVEFYTYIPFTNRETSPNYIIAQAILPKSYNDILLVKKKFLLNFKPRGLELVKTEWGEFNDKFLLYADKIDGATSFELLTTNFMAKIFDLPFELNIEVVDNVLYIYSKTRNELDYNKLLEILSWAFDEMKM